MRRHLLLFILSLMCMWAKADSSVTDTDYTIKSVRYWFDTVGQPATCTYSGKSMTLDASSLADGLHILYYQLITANDGAAPVTTCTFMKISENSLGGIIADSYSIKSVRYWFDPSGETHTAGYTGNGFTLDASALADGIHTLYYQLITANDGAAPTGTCTFMKVSDSDLGGIIADTYNIKSVRYWIDRPGEVQTSSYAGKSFTLDASALADGVHTLYYQLITENGIVAPTATSTFMKISDDDPGGIIADTYNIKSVRYWFDRPGDVQTSDYADKSFTLDASALTDGIHVLYYQFVCSNGLVSPAKAGTFIKVSENGMSNIGGTYTPQTIHYWIDGNEKDEKSVPYVTSSVSLDCKSLTEGDHTLYYQVYADDKKVSPVSTQTFERSFYDISIGKTQTFKEGAYSDSLMAVRPFMILTNRTADTSVLGHLTVEADDNLSLGKFTQRLNYGTKTGDSRFVNSGEDYYHLSSLVNEGYMRSDSVNIESRYYKNRWYFISLPFDANISDIKTEDGVRWVVRTYDGAERAAGHVSNTWNNLAYTDMMEAGKGYIIQATRSDGENMCKFVFPAINDSKKNHIFASADQTVELEENLAEFNHNRSWNFIANPYPSFYDSRMMNFDAPITVWNGSGYDAYSLEDDDYVFMPYEGFFVQKPVVGDAVTFDRQGRQHTSEVRNDEEVKARRAPIVLSNAPVRRLYNFYISDGSNEDHCRIVLNENAARTYEMERDASKFMNMDASKPMIYTSYDGVVYAINERPVGDGIVPLCISAQTDSVLTLRYEAGKNAEGIVLLVDSYTGESFNLTESDVELAPEACADQGRYYISFVDAPTAIEAIKAASPEMGEPSIIYDVQGRAVNKTAGNRIYIQNGRKFLEK